MHNKINFPQQILLPHNRHRVVYRHYSHNQTIEYGKTGHYHPHHRSNLYVNFIIISLQTTDWRCWCRKNALCTLSCFLYTQFRVLGSYKSVAKDDFIMSCVLVTRTQLYDGKFKDAWENRYKLRCSQVLFAHRYVHRCGHCRINVREENLLIIHRHRHVYHRFCIKIAVIVSIRWQIEVGYISSIASVNVRLILFSFLAYMGKNFSSYRIDTRFKYEIKHILVITRSCVGLCVGFEFIPWKLLNNCVVNLMEIYEYFTKLDKGKTGCLAFYTAQAHKSNIV